MPESNPWIQNRQNPPLTSFFKGWGRYETIFVLGVDGKSVATSDGNPVDLSDRAYFKEALSSGKTVISQPVFSKATGNLVMAIATPVINSENKTVGVVAATVPMTYISTLMSSAAMGETW
jgi:methyl-accepting chemotaxis protein